MQTETITYTVDRQAVHKGWADEAEVGIEEVGLLHKVQCCPPVTAPHLAQEELVLAKECGAEEARGCGTVILGEAASEVRAPPPNWCRRRQTGVIAL
jgi:hypothetical protein